ncbi:MAG: invasion associated locus B family protein [Rhizobiales bacterium]|nr:invasion associated locus B family protein [Hyphomicrobiales bacterium]
MKRLQRSFVASLCSTMLVALMATHAYAQQQAPATQPPAAGQQPAAPVLPEGWFKICQVDPKENKKICAINIQVPGNDGKPIASLRITDFEGVKQKGFTMAVPPGLLIQPGMRIQIDGANTGTAKFQVCSPQACFVEARFEDTLVTSMKRGKDMKVIGIGTNGKQVEFPISLAGFTATYDGPPIDPSLAAESRETLQQRLQRKAEEARQRLLEKAPAEGAAAPGATGAAPAPKPQ